MNKFITKLAKLTLGLAMAAGVGVAIGAGKKNTSLAKADDAEAYTIVFNDNGNNNDGTQGKTAIADLVDSGAGYISSVSASSVFLGKQNCGLKFASNNNAGSLTINLSSTGDTIGQVKATKVTFRVGAVSASKTMVLKLNEATSGNTGYRSITTPSTTGASGLTDYDVAWDGTTTLTKIQIDCAKKNASYLHSIKVYISGTTSYDVTPTITNGSFDGALKVEKNSDLEGYILPTELSSHDYPGSLTSITMGGNAISSGSGDGQYEYDSSNGKLTVHKVTGVVVFSATCPALTQYSIATTGVTGGTVTGATSIYGGRTATITLVPDSTHVLPAQSAITVNGADISSYSNGVLTISKSKTDTDSVSISVSMPAKVSNTISATLSSHIVADNGNPTTVLQGATVELGFTISGDYGFPDSVTVIGASSSTWSHTTTTGTLSITGGDSGLITFSITEQAKALTDDDLTLSASSGTYYLGETFTIPTATAHFNLGDEEVTPTYSLGNYADSDGMLIAVTDNAVNIEFSYTFGNKTQTANYTLTVKAKAVKSAGYYKVTSTQDLDLNVDYIIVCEAYNTAMSTTQNDNNRGKVDVTISESVITTLPNTAQTFTVSSATIGGKTGYQFYTGSGYIYAASSSKNYLRTQTTNDANGLFSITFSSGNAALVAQGSNTNNNLKYNNSSSIYSCYGSGQSPVQLYKYQAATTKSLIRIDAVLKDGVSTTVGSTLTASDFTVTANYDDNTSEVVTSNITVMGGSLSEVGSKNVTISYGGKSKQLTITVLPAQAVLDHLSWSQSDVYGIVGQILTKSSLSNFDAYYVDVNDPVSKAVTEEGASVGLYSDDQGTKTLVRTITSSYTWVAGDNGLYLGVSYEENDRTRVAYGGRAYVSEVLNDINPTHSGSFDETLDVSTKGYVNEQVVTSVVCTNFSVGLTKGGTNDPKYYTSDETLRVYNGGKLTISSTKTITRIDFTGTIVISTTTGTYSDSVWTGSATEVEFSVTGTTKLKTIKVTYYDTVIDDNIANTDAHVQKCVLDFVGAMMGNDYLGSCSASSNFDTSKWSGLKSAFTNAEKGGDSTLFANMFKYATAAQRDSSGNTPTGDTLQKALARYDYVIDKYKSDLGDDYDFLGRIDAGTASVHSHYNLLPLFNITKNNTIAIIVIISMVSVTAIGGYFFLRKRKEQ